MVSSSYYGDYGYRGYGYNNQGGGSMLGNTSMSSAYSTIGDAPDLDPANVHGMTDGLSETYNNAMKPQEEKGGGFFGGIGDFFKGIVKGATNLVKSLADPKTWLMIGAAALLCFIFPPAGYALLALGLFTSGSQILGGLTSGNMEQVGEGAFNLGLTAVGAKSMGGAVKGKDGITYTASAGKAAKAASSADEAVGIASKADDAAALAAKQSTGSADDIANLKTLQNDAKAAHLKADEMMALKSKTEARVAYQNTPKADRKALVDGKPTQENISAAKTSMDNARSSLYEKQGALAKLKTSDSGYAGAKSAVDDAQSLLHNQTQAYRSMQYQYDLASQANRGFFGKTWDSIGDNFTVMKGGKLADPKSIGKPGQGSTQQISLYNRGPKPPKTEPPVGGANQQVTTARQQAQTDADALATLRESNPKGLPDKQYIEQVKAARLKADESAANYQAALKNQKQVGDTTPTTTTEKSGGFMQSAKDKANSAKETVQGWFSSGKGDKTAGQSTSMTDKAKGFFSQKIDPKTGQPIDKGAAGYWNYLINHKVQSGAQGYTLGQMLGGGQQQGQGGGLFSMFGMGGGAQGGGLLG